MLFDCRNYSVIDWCRQLFCSVALKKPKACNQKMNELFVPNCFLPKLDIPEYCSILNPFMPPASQKDLTFLWQLNDKSIFWKILRVVIIIRDANQEFNSLIFLLFTLLTAYIYHFLTNLYFFLCENNAYKNSASLSHLLQVKLRRSLWRCGLSRKVTSRTARMTSTSTACLTTTCACGNTCRSTRATWWRWVTGHVPRRNSTSSTSRPAASSLSGKSGCHRPYIKPSACEKVTSDLGSVIAIWWISAPYYIQPSTYENVDSDLGSVIAIWWIRAP